MGRLHGRRRAVCADLAVFAVFHGPTATSRCHQERVLCGENPTKKYTRYKSVQSSCWRRQRSPPVPLKKNEFCYHSSNRGTMHTRVNSSVTKDVISQTLPRGPSFLHQLQNHHVGESFVKQILTKRDQKEKKKNYKAAQLSKNKI